VKPKVILSGKGTQFQFPSRKGTMQKYDVEFQYSAIRHQQSNASDRCMREISKFYRIYCHSNHQKWTEMIPHIENWLNNTFASATLYTPVELLFGAERNKLFQKCLPRLLKGEMKHEQIQDKIAKLMRERSNEHMTERTRESMEMQCGNLG
jgi:tRNA(Ser,Leu) C12 N-acetylase TAN1